MQIYIHQLRGVILITRYRLRHKSLEAQPGGVSDALRGRKVSGWHQIFSSKAKGDALHIMQCLTDMHRFSLEPLEKTDWWQQQMGEEKSKRDKNDVGVLDGKAEEKEVEAEVIRSDPPQLRTSC